MRKALLTAAVVLYASPPYALESDTGTGVIVRAVFKTTETISGQPIVLPQKNPQIVVSTYEIAPGAILPVHEHIYPRYAFVMAGTLRVSNEKTGKSHIFEPGDFIVESIKQWHRGENIGAEAVKLLVIDQVEKGDSNVILRK